MRLQARVYIFWTSIQLARVSRSCLTAMSGGAWRQRKPIVWIMGLWAAFGNNGINDIVSME